MVGAAQEQLGRTNPSFTLGIYSQAIGDAQRFAAEKVPGFWTILDHKPNRKVN